MSGKPRLERNFIETVTVCALVFAWTILPMQVLYSVSARTESVSMTVESATDWELRRAMRSDASHSAAPFSGFVRVRPGAVVSVRRVGEGRLRIRIEDPKATTSSTAGIVADLRDAADQPSGEIVGSATFTMRLKRGGALTLSFVGDLRLPAVPSRGSYGPVPMLRAGTVAMSARTFGGFGSDRYYTGRRTLSAGDEFHVDDPAEGQGFIRIDERPAMTVAYWTAGTTGRVSAFGREYTFGTSVWDRVSQDPILQLAWTIAVAFGLWNSGPWSKRRGAQGVLVLALLAATVAPAAADITVVHVLSEQHGVGLPRWWDGHCYVITPAHVVANVHGEIGLVGMHRREARAESYWSNDGLDLAVLRVTSGEDGACQDHSAVGSGPLDDLLARTTQGTLRSLGPDGGERRTPVVVTKVQDTHVEVAPAIAGGAIAQGQSGSVLEVGGRPAGMLLRVTEQGRGRVIREDYLEKVIVTPSRDGWPVRGRTVCLRHDAATAALVEPFADAIREKGGQPRTDCKRRVSGADTLTLSGTESTDQLGDDWIVSVRATVVVERVDGQESHVQIQVRGASTLDAKRARAGLADDLREQIEKVNDLEKFVGIKAGDQRIGGSR